MFKFNFITKVFFLTTIILFSFCTSLYAKSGCCSWHDGVSHCDTSVGRYVCNDGTYSPSCTCVKYTQPSYTPPVYTPPKEEEQSYVPPAEESDTSVQLYSYPENGSYSESDSDDSAVVASYAIIGGGGLLAYLLRNKK